MTLRVYLAGRYSDRAHLAARADELTAIGYEVTARWLTGAHDTTDGSDGLSAASEQQSRWASDDLWDLGLADLLIYFADSPERRIANLLGTGWYSGGRHVELGYALAKNIPIVLVGEPENVFHHLSAVTIVPDWHAAVIELAARLVAHHRDEPKVGAA